MSEISQCVVEGCEKHPRGRRGMCVGHYKEWRLNRESNGLCGAEDCRERQFCRGLCRKHYRRLDYRGGIPDKRNYASSKGTTALDRLMSKVSVDNSGCWLWSPCDGRPLYGVVCCGGKNIQAHRLSYELHHGPIDHGMVVRHTCGVPSCVNPDHLVTGTQADNVADAIRDATQSGKTCFNPKMTVAEVRYIRQQADRGRLYTDIAKELGRGRLTVSRAARRVTWAWVTDASS